MLTEKPILTITVAASLLKLHPRTLMLYERNELLSPYRTSTKRRLYSKKDLNDLQFIKYLTQNQGTNLKGVKILLKAIRIANRHNIDLKKKLFPDFKPKRIV